MENNETKVQASGGEILSFLAGGAIGLVVLLFLGLHSINFFTYIFKDEQSYLAWLGFGLTGGAFVAYFIKFLFGNGSNLKSTIAFLMMLVSGGGEIATAYFGMQIEAWKKAGFSLTEKDYEAMFMVIGALAFLHLMAQVGYWGGDKIASLFYIDFGKLFRRKKETANTPATAQPTLSLASETEQEALARPNGSVGKTANPTMGKV